MRATILPWAVSLSLPRATIVAKLGYPLISIYSKGIPGKSQGIP